ncbi:hypothetical protein ABPG72_003450 [Tetrahymena utriculariae]
MSIYSGFATRQIEQTYNIMVEQLFKILQKRLLKFYRQESVNEHAFADCIKKLLTQMSFFERQKHLPPKFSDNCKELAAFLKLSIPSNVSLFTTKKNKEQNQQQSNNKNENQSQHIDKLQNVVKQNIEMPNVNYGEPLKSEVNIQNNDCQHSLFSTNTFQVNNNEQKQQIQNSQNSNKFRDGKQNFITLEAAYNNSSSSMSPNTSIHSSLASLGKSNINNQKQIIAQLQEQKVQDQQKNIIKEYNPQKNDKQANLVRQIVEGQKKVIQTIDQKHSTEFKRNNLEERPIIQGSTKNSRDHKILQENTQNELNQINENSPKQFRAIKKFPIQNQIEKTQNQSQEQQQLNQILSQKVNTVEGNSQTYQTIGDETQIVPLMNKKKNKRSHTTKRQRKRNQILNNIYMNGDDFSTVHVGSSNTTTTTAVNLNNYQKRSRSSQRSQEQYNSKRGCLKLQQQNYLMSSDSDKNRLQDSEKVSINNLDKQTKMNKFNNNYCEANTNINSTSGSYNPSTNVSRQNFTSKVNQIQNQSNQANNYQLNQKDPFQINCDQTMYSVKHQISESANKFGTILQNNSNNNNQNQSIMVESFNSRTSRQKLDTNLTINYTDEEPQQSKINENKNLQNKKSDNNSSIELKRQFYPFNGSISTKNKTPQKQRVLQNSSLNNSLQNTQTALKQNTQQNGGSYQFNQMYKNGTTTQNNSKIYQHLNQKQNNISNSNKKRLHSEDSSKVFKFSNNQLDQSTSDEQFKNNSLFDASNISKKESISPQKKRNQNNAQQINNNVNSNNIIKQNILNNKISSNIIKQNMLCNDSTQKEQSELN